MGPLLGSLTFSSRQRLAGSDPWVTPIPASRVRRWCHHQRCQDRSPWKGRVLDDFSGTRVAPSRDVVPLSKQRRVGPRRALSAALALALVGVASALLVTCSQYWYGASDANFALAEQREARGGELYGRECAGCHGPRGEGLASNPPLMGPGALRTYVHQPTSTISGTPERVRVDGVNMDRLPFFTADDLYDYVAHHRRWVSHCCHVLLASDEYWEIVSYILVGHGSRVPPGGVHPYNASAVTIKPVARAAGSSAP